MHDSYKIYQVPEERRYWVVRAESGQYFDHFTKFGVIALGHLNLLELNDKNDVSDPLAWDTLKGNYTRHAEADKMSKRQISTLLSQAKTFLYEIKLGDWVLTVGNSAVRFGRITSNPFVEKQPLIYVHDDNSGAFSEMDMHLRRRVEWGPLIARKNLPFGLLISLKANQTIFCLDSKWDAIYHTLYPAFLRGATLHLSLKIKTQGRIRNHDVSTIFNLLDEVEVLGKEFSNNDTIFDFETVFNNYVETDRLTITTKAQFHSPGEIWNAITANVGNVDLNHWATYTFFVYSLLFGNKKMGIDGVVDIDTRKKLWQLAIDRLRVNRAERVVDALQIELPKIDTSKLEGADNSSDNSDD